MNMQAYPALPVASTFIWTAACTPSHMVVCADSYNVQVEADNLDCVTRSALLAQENQYLKERLETQTQQMLHVQEQVCGLRALLHPALFLP